MARLILAILGVVLLAVAALALVWLLGQVIVGLGVFVVGLAAVLSRLLWFLIVAGALAGLVYFLASAWRPSVRAGGAGAGQPEAMPPRTPSAAAHKSRP